MKITYSEPVYSRDAKPDIWRATVTATFADDAGNVLRTEEVSGACNIQNEAAEASVRRQILERVAAVSSEIARAASAAERAAVVFAPLKSNLERGVIEPVVREVIR